MGFGKLPDIFGLEEDTPEKYSLKYQVLVCGFDRAVVYFMPKILLVFLDTDTAKNIAKKWILD
jgi:hypothetical protein